MKRRVSGLLLVIATIFPALPTAAGEAYSLLAVWGEGGSGSMQFKEPMGIAVDSHGYVYVADSRNQRVLKLSSDGKAAAEFGGPEVFRKPMDVAVGPEGTIYACDYDADNIQAFSPEGKRLFVWGGPGEKDGQFHAPAGIAVDKAGDVFVADFYNHRIQVFDPKGRWTKTLGKKGHGEGEFTYPTGLSFDGNGNLLVADAYNHRIQKLSRQGRALGIWGSSLKRLIGLSKAFHVPSGVAVDAFGNIHVADSANKRVVSLASDGTFLAEWRPSNDLHANIYSPTHVAAGPEGRVYAVDTANDRIFVLGLGAPALPSSMSRASPTLGATEQMPGDVLVRIDGMACPFCAYGIEKHLARLPGVSSARVNLGQGTAVLKLEPGKTLSFEEVQKAVEKAGFKASELKAVSPMGEHGRP